MIVAGIALFVGFLFAVAGIVLFPLESVIITGLSITIMVAFLRYAIRKDVELQFRSGRGEVLKGIGWEQMHKLSESERWRQFRIVNYQEAWIFSVAIILGLLIGLTLR